MHRTALLVVLVLAPVVGLLLIPDPSRASLYSPDDPTMSLDVGPDGKGQPLKLEEIKRRRAKLMNMLNPQLAGNDDRKVVLERIATRQKLKTRSQLENAALAGDLLRTGNPGEAAELFSRDRRGFIPNMTLAHIHAQSGDWATAAEYLTIATGEKPPTELPGLTPAQLAWQQKINEGPLTELFRTRWQESRNRPNPDTETVDPIFPVRFLNAAGQYEPGVLSPAERAALPADAVAIVQQLLLWFPTDPRLFWLLGEVYAATGDLHSAQQVFDDCVSEAWKYGNRKVLQAHRTAVRAAAAAQPRPTPPEDVPLGRPTISPQDTPQDQDTPPQESPISMRTVWIYFGIVALVGVLALVRFILRRRAT